MPKATEELATNILDTASSLVIEDTMLFSSFLDLFFTKESLIFIPSDSVAVVVMVRNGNTVSPDFLLKFIPFQPN